MRTKPRKTASGFKNAKRNRKKQITQTVEEINRALLDKKIFGGKDLSKEFPQLGQAALYCVTEIHTGEDLDYLASALAEIIG